MTLKEALLAPAMHRATNFFIDVLFQLPIATNHQVRSRALQSDSCSRESRASREAADAAAAGAGGGKETCELQRDPGSSRPCTSRRLT